MLDFSKFFKCTEEHRLAVVLLYFTLRLYFNVVSLILFVHNVEKWPNILLKSCGVNTARTLKYAWAFFNIMHERAKEVMPSCINVIVTYSVGN